MINVSQDIIIKYDMILKVT